MRIVRPLLMAAAAAALAGCVPRAAPPAPTPAPIPQPVPPPPPAPAPAPPADWQDRPLSPGDWSYRGAAGDPLATFQSDRLRFTLRCAPNRVIVIGLGGVAAPAVTLRTSSGERRLAATAHVAETIAELPAADPLLDQLAFSRGRFLIQAEGMADLVVPAWPEAARVIEDCRG